MLQFAIAQHSPTSSQPGCHCNRFALHAPGSQHGTFGAFTGGFGFSGVGSSGFRGKALALSFAGTAMHRLGVAFFLRIFASALRELGTFLSGELKPKGLEKTWAAFEFCLPPGAPVLPASTRPGHFKLQVYALRTSPVETRLSRAISVFDGDFSDCSLKLAARVGLRIHAKWLPYTDGRSPIIPIYRPGLSLKAVSYTPRACMS